MKTVLKTTGFLFLIFSGFYLSAQSYSILKDTAYFSNYGRPVQVVQTYLTHYYYLDTVCIKLISFPLISGFSSASAENDLNIEFSHMFVFDECREDDKNCDMPPLKFGPVRAKFSLAMIHHIKNDLLSYMVTEGECLENQNTCTRNVRFHMRDLRTGNEIESHSVFRKDGDSQDAVMWLVVQQLDVIPPEPESILQNVQIFFDSKFIYFYYEKDAIENDERITLGFAYDVLSPYLDRKSPLARLWKDDRIKRAVSEKRFSELKR